MPYEDDYMTKHRNRKLILRDVISRTLGTKIDRFEVL